MLVGLPERDLSPYTLSIPSARVPDVVQRGTAVSGAPEIRPLATGSIYSGADAYGMADLSRAIGLSGATVYGVGLILGAGIYAVLGAAVAVTGEAIILSFVLAAAVAALTGLSYAELASRFPKGEGEYLYAYAAFGNKRLSEFTALFRVATGIIAAGAVALAFGNYLSSFTTVPIVPAAVGLLVLMSAINIWGIETSTAVNVLFTTIEIVGLVFIIVLGIGDWGTVDVTAATNGLTGILEGTFLVFFAYVGFESLVNITEETRDPSRTIPRAIGLSILISTVVYILVGLSALGLVSWEVLGRSAAPLSEVARAGMGESAFLALSAIALFATANTVLIILISTSRLVYGVSKAEYNSFPTVFSRIHPTRKTPYIAVMLVGVVTVPFALLGELGLVAALANFALLVVFVIVNASLLKLRLAGPTPDGGYRVPLSVRNVPLPAVGGLISSLGLLGFYVVQLL